MKSKVYYQRIPLEDDDFSTIEFDPDAFFSQCPDGFEANQATFKYSFTSTHLILSCDIIKKQTPPPPVDMDDLHPTFDL